MNPICPLAAPSFVGCFAGALDDATAKDVGVGFHEALVNGAPVAQALHQAVIAGDPDRAEVSVSRLSYAISGYGDIALPITTAPPPSCRPKRRRSQ